MIYVDNNSNYPQRVYIPRDEDLLEDLRGYQSQRKDYVINNNGLTYIYPDPGYDGISGGTISVYVSAATGVTFEHLDVTEDGIYVPTGDSAYSGVTVQVYDGAYQDGFNDGYSSGYTVGFNDGYSSGMTDGYASGSTAGFEAGYTSGVTDGFGSGYTSGHTDGYSSGVTDGFGSGYTSGMTDGYASGYTAGYASGNTDGFNGGYHLGYSSGYTSGYTDGSNNQKSLLTSTTITENGTYTKENGWSAVTVSVTGGSYNEGYEAGVEHQKSLLGSYNFTANTGPDAVVFQDGISAATVNIPVSDIMVTATTNGEYRYIATDGLYAGVQFTVDVPQTGSTPVLTAGTFNQNGQYFPPAGVDGFSSVFVGVNTAQTYVEGFQDGYSSGHTEGFQDGEEHQKGLLSSATFTDNGTYTREDGWSSVTVDINTAATYNSGYTEGYSSGRTRGFSEGVAAQKGLLTAETFTENGTYTRANGWDEVTVNVPLTSLTVTQNGVYTPSSGGYNRVIVDVPQTPTILTVTQAQYDAIPVKDNNTIYLIKD